MPVITGSGDYQYEVVENWAKFPGAWSYDVAGIGVDSKDRVYLFNRGETPVIVVDADGRVLDRWGDKRTFPNAHAVTMGPDDTIWLTDTLDHTVRQFTLGGELLLTIGTSGKPALPMSGDPFCQCTHVAIHPKTGELFVADGYCNARVHKYSPDGRLLYSWGEPGNEPGQFNLPHNICTDREGYVYVADRHNNRVQVFASDGKLEAVWTGMALPCGLFVDTAGREQLCYIAELSSAFWLSPGRGWWDFWNATKRMGPRVSVYGLDGRLRAKLCDNGQGSGPDQLFAPHGIAVNRQGDIYVAEVSWTLAKVLDGDQPSSGLLRNVVKLAKTSRAADGGRQGGVSA